MKKAVVAMGGGGGGKGAAGTAPTDLLVCFPARQRLALMPKPICSPSRSTMDKAAAARRRSQMPGARSSPMFRGSKAKRTAEEDDDEEPRSPKVTCAGQIKVGRPKKTRAADGKRSGKEGAGGGGAKSWITVVEEIERMHGRRKKVGWLEAVGIKTDALPFLGGVMRSLRLKARCLGSFRGAVDSSTDDEDGDGDGERGSAPTSVFSKWLMVLESGKEPSSEQDSGDDEERDEEGHEDRQSKETDECSNAPPPNALLLMRCRSAPAKGMSRIAAEPPPSEAEQEKGSAHAVAGDAGTEEDNRDDLVFMNSAPGFLKLSIDIAKETWLVGGGGDPLSRSRSWKR